MDCWVGRRAWCAGLAAAESGHPGPNLSCCASHHCSVGLLIHRLQPARSRTPLWPVPQDRAPRLQPQVPEGTVVSPGPLAAPGSRAADVPFILHPPGSRGGVTEGQHC